MLRKRKYEKEVQLVLSNASKNNNILLEVYYNNIVVCEVKLNVLDEKYELTISFKSEKYKNEEFLSVVIEQTSKYVKNVLKSKEIITKIIRTEENYINVFKSLGFIYENEDDNYVYFLKKLK